MRLAGRQILVSLEMPAIQPPKLHQLPPTIPHGPATRRSKLRESEKPSTCRLSLSLDAKPSTLSKSIHLRARAGTQIRNPAFFLFRGRDSFIRQTEERPRPPQSLCRIAAPRQSDKIQSIAMLCRGMVSEPPSARLLINAKTRTRILAEWTANALARFSRKRKNLPQLRDFKPLRNF
ncbi:MAG: hypothetical protein EBY32_00900 [Proteobacteria bacterium]|nr:hypothetical protein [Pseudomonadota bacterium]